MSEQFHLNGDKLTLRVLVCGSRTWKSEDMIVDQVLHGIRASYDNADIVLIEGGAKGADSCAAFWAQVTEGVELETYPAKWDEYGKRAGYLRNAEMLAKGKPNLVLAFVDKPLEESKGTAMMVGLAQDAKVPTYVIERKA